ncbi:large ribosomal subunit protein bL21m-like [Ptychodera flava]|uniref:large ribosomal subunit protein bL21m-like n=1 Tax=Ptychodera flava TaxID=63121 RepID=UPI00396A49BE
MAASISRCALLQVCRFSSQFTRFQTKQFHYGILNRILPSRLFTTSCAKLDRSAITVPSVNLDLEDVERRLTLPERRRDAVVSKVNADIQVNASRLFAVVYIHRQQFKITAGDLIQIIDHIEADVGDKIRLEKVLMVGGDNFSLIGRPLLSRDLVEVWATVIEKTETPTKIFFQKKRRKGFRRWVEYKDNLSVLRINTINVTTVTEDN